MKTIKKVRDSCYAVYKGDTMICFGTPEECAKFMGVKYETIRFMTTPTYKKRRKKGENFMEVIKIDEIDNDKYVLLDKQKRSMI